MNIFKDFLLQLTFIAVLIFTFQIFFAERSDRNGRVKIVLSVLFGFAILLCMTFPVQITTHIHIDIRIIPLLLGTLYGGWRTCLVLASLIVIYRLYLGVDPGLLTTTLTLLFSMPIIIFSRKFFVKARKLKKIQTAIVLSVCYSLIGVLTVAITSGFSYRIFRVQVIYILIIIIVMVLFTALIETIKDTIRHNQQLQSDVKDAEIAFLRSQIKPHFLYNVLNSIASLCIDEPHKAEELTLELAQYLRGSFDFKRLDSLTTLENELNLVKAYINIEKARFGDRLRVEYHVDANPGLLIPPLILQPLVENAIHHGLMPNIGGGTVIIFVQQEANAAVNFSVEDNGCGMNEHKQDEVLKSDVHKKGIGLRNINQRLRLRYGESIHIESTVGTGTKVMFNIPLRTNKPMADAYEVSFASQN